MVGPKDSSFIATLPGEPTTITPCYRRRLVVGRDFRASERHATKSALQSFYPLSLTVCRALFVPTPQAATFFARVFAHASRLVGIVVCAVRQGRHVLEPWLDTTALD